MLEDTKNNANTDDAMVSSFTAADTATATATATAATTTTTVMRLVPGMTVQQTTESQEAKANPSEESQRWRALDIRAFVSRLGFYRYTILIPMTSAVKGQRRNMQNSQNMENHVHTGSLSN